MIYTKIRLDFIRGPKDRFYRTVLIKGNPDLFELGICLGLALGATYEHCFLITTKDSSYVMAPFMEEPDDGYKYLRRYYLSDLPDEFNYEYDTGEGWNFACKRYEEKIELNNTRQKIIVLEGKGQGIWEDNIGSLYALFEGRVDPNSSEEDEYEGYYKPWNYKIDKFGDFDLPLNVEALNEELKKKAARILRQILLQEIAYAEQRHVCLDDFHDNRPSFQEWYKTWKEKNKA